MKGSNPEIDRALRLIPKIRAFLKQDLFEAAPYEQITQRMQEALRG